MSDGVNNEFERDLAIRDLKTAKADLQVIKLALEENRPLEALRQVNEAIERREDEIGGFEELEAAEQEDEEHRLSAAEPAQQPKDSGSDE